MGHEGSVALLVLLSEDRSNLESQFRSMYLTPRATDKETIAIASGWRRWSARTTDSGELRTNRLQLGSAKVTNGKAEPLSNREARAVSFADPASTALPPTGVRHGLSLAAAGRWMDPKETIFCASWST